VFEQSGSLWALSASGWLVGEIWKFTNRDWLLFLWHTNHELKKITFPASPTIHKLNNLGQFVGSMEMLDLRDPYRETYGVINVAFLSSPDLGVIQLSNHEKNADAFGINDKSEVVGFIDVRSPFEFGADERAFIYDNKNGRRELNSLISPDSGWDTLERAFEISDNGSILGKGKFHGVEQYFLLTPKK
jgi:hypothetical protein